MIEISENLRNRIISSLVMIPLVLLIVLIGGWVLYVSLICLGILMSFEWANITQRSDTRELTEAQKRRWLLVGLAYVAVPIGSVLTLIQDSTGVYVLLWLVLVVIATDTAAYFSGRYFGGPKLAPTVSPNKTWAGLLGGIIAASTIGLLFGLIMSQASVSEMLLLSMLLAVVAQVGDLAESSLKRYFGVKDSGFIIPGHGGVLDRLDGYVTAIPVGLAIHWASGGIF